MVVAQSLLRVVGFGISRQRGCMWRNWGVEVVKESKRKVMVNLRRE